ncbi:MAG TPA: Lrp/AsnC family transcriptional regulator [Caulobacter sp.]|nr:Lrp/AsnC family transcriptional regulator [Caulobacter sp.]HWU79486.1 Lrp/AsnC family transcriptional regulator [Caulobacter sp.]
MIGMITNKIDDGDRRLLRALQQDCSRSTAELAAVAGLSQPVCWRKLQRLRETGVIVRESAVLDREKLGFSVQVFALVKLTSVGRANLSDFSERIRAMPEVVECHVLMGAADFLLKVVAKDIHDYERIFFEQLSQLEGVQDITSSVALSEIKAWSGVPL